MSNEIWTIGRLLRWTEQYFRGKGIDTPRLDGEVLLSHVLKVERIYLYAHYDQPLERQELADFKKLILRRVEGKSVAALCGVKEFMGIPFKVNEHTLIPRPDTETLVEGVLQLLHRETSYHILDLCTGPGTILLSLLYYLPKSTGVGIDLSQQALAVASENSKALQLEERVRWHHSNLYVILDDKTGTEREVFDLITANPPYIKRGDLNKLAREVQAEPQMALDGGESGLDFYKPLLLGGQLFLKPKGYLALEIGQGQEEDVIAIAEALGGYKLFGQWKDIHGIIRTLVFQREELANEN